MPLAIRLFVVVLAAALCACTQPRPSLLISDPELTVKIPAMKKAVREKDKKAAGDLVKELDSDDPAVRFYALESLQRLTGQRFGYEYYYDKDQRKPSLKRWQQWLAQQEAAATQGSAGK